MASPHLDEVDLLRFTTAGSVDDGKSTLIGRLLHDTQSIFDDQLHQIEGASRRRGEGELDLALLTDGLRAEREQQITIDVAYRYFGTPKRRFIIADTPGHVQYTRNMVTGASTADLAVILVDATRGVMTQSRRHAFISSLLGIPNLVVAVNKMDLVGYRPEAFEAIRADFEAFADGLEVRHALSFVPISALEGDQVVERSRRMPWYTGPTLLEVLEAAPVRKRRTAGEFRFPVQAVLRPDASFRGYAGTVASGVVEVGQEVVVLPAGETTSIDAIETPEGPVPRASAGEAVVLTTRDELDISRGDLLAPVDAPPEVASRIDAEVCWMDRTPLDPAQAYLLLLGTRQLLVRVDDRIQRVEMDTLARDETSTLELNEIGRTTLAAAEPFPFDLYGDNAATGSFVLVDPRSNQTAAAGMIRRAIADPERPEEPVGVVKQEISPNVAWEGEAVSRAEREARNGHGAAVLWLTGISGAGKTTIARETERALFRRGVRTAFLDGDRLRHGLCGDLAFSDADRAENLRRAGEVARILFDHGAVVLASFISPVLADRERVRGLIPSGGFFEIHVHAPLSVARLRDPKGLYRREEEGGVDPLPGSRGRWEPPEAPALVLDTTRIDPTEAARRIVQLLEAEGLLTAPTPNLHRTGLT